MMNKYTHDLRGNPVDGLVLGPTRRRPSSGSLYLRSAGNDRAAEIAECLVETADDVSAELAQEQMSFWQEEDDGEHAEEVHDEMMRAIARGSYTPPNPTWFVADFIRRVRGAPAS
jgi:hypothetical protein